MGRSLGRGSCRQVQMCMSLVKTLLLTTRACARLGRACGLRLKCLKGKARRISELPKSPEKMVSPLSLPLARRKRSPQQARARAKARANPRAKGKERSKAVSKEERAKARHPLRL